MHPIDVAGALTGLPTLRVSNATTEEEAASAFPRLATFDGGGLYAGSFSGLTPWERHGTGDELLYVLAGAVEITILTAHGRHVAVLGKGEVLIVPKGLWHRQEPKPEVTLLTITPDTHISRAENPRIEPAGPMADSAPGS